MFDNRISRTTGETLPALPELSSYKLEEGTIRMSCLQGVLTDSKIVKGIADGYLQLSLVLSARNPETVETLLDKADESLSAALTSLTQERAAIGDRTADALSLARSQLVEALEIGIDDRAQFAAKLEGAIEFVREATEAALDSVAERRLGTKAA